MTDELFRWRKTADLRFELLSLFGRIILRVPGDVTATDVLDGDVLDVESNVVSGARQLQGRVVHLDRLHLSGHVHRGKCHDHAGLQGARFHSTDRHGSNT